MRRATYQYLPIRRGEPRLLISHSLCSLAPEMRIGGIGVLLLLLRAMIDIDARSDRL